MALDGRPSVALVSREFWPFHTGGGIARYTRATAALLADVADVTVILPDFYAGKVPLDDPRIPQGVTYEFVPEPNRADPRPFASLYHAWSAAARDALRELFPGGGPDLVEFNEYTGEGAVTVQAKRSGAPELARTRIVVSIHGTDEIHRVLNGQSLREPESAALTALERIGLAGADAIFSPAGDVHATYERYYGAGAIGPARAVPHPFVAATDEPLPPREGGGPLRLLHVGRFERRKGVAELIAAVRSLRTDDVRLTLLGSDTPTGPGGTSMLEHCRRLAGADERIELRGPTDLEGVFRCYAEHDVVVIASRWETNANTAREALSVGRPVLATPTGGLVRIVDHGVNGWLTEGTSAGELAEAIEELVADRGRVERLLGSPALRASLSRSVDNDGARTAYLDELGSPRREADAGGGSVAVCAVGSPGSELERTLASIRDQTRPPGSLVTAEPGLGGFAPPPGDAVAFVPAGAALAPAFLETCARALAAAPDAAYVTTWADAHEPWHARPLGNAVPLVEAEDCGGAVLVVRSAHASAAAARIASAELAGAGSWLLARELRAEGLYGLAVPEELVDLRGAVHAEGMDAEARRVEVEAALLRARTRWPAPASEAA